MSIPASQIVDVNSSVISAGGRALQLNGVLLTQNIRVPLNSILGFPDTDSVGAYFGLSSDEYVAAGHYFLGFRNSTRKPGILFIFSYSAAPVAAFLRGGSLAGTSLAGLKAMTGDMTVLVDGTSYTASGINLSAATSFSNAAPIIQAAFTTPGFTVSFDDLSSAFQITSKTTGATSSIALATGSLALLLNLAANLGAVVSPGSAPMTPASAMNMVKSKTLNWAVFTTLFEPSTSDCLAFAAWNVAQNKRFAYMMWDSNPAPTVLGDTSSVGYLARASNMEGTAPIYTGSFVIAVFMMGAIASLNFDQKNGRATMAFRDADGLTPDVTDGVVSQNLKLNGYNFYGDYALDNDDFHFLYPGTIIGQYEWIDSYVNQIWLKGRLQLAMMNLLREALSIPYNSEGYAMIHAAALDPILAALNFGAIRAGVSLSELQKAELNEAAGLKIDTVVSQEGWFFQVNDAPAITRGQRQTPPISLFYADGESVQQITVASIAIQ